MYNEKLKPILEDLENKDIEIAGGSVVGMALSQINSLVKYICNLTIGKTKYEDVQEEVISIKNEAEVLKHEVLEVIDQDKKVLEKVLKAYKIRKENPEEFEIANKNAVQFCIEVTNKALETLKLASRISKVGNKMMSSDFKICSLYGFSSVEASIINVKINLDSVKDEEYKEKKREEYLKIYEEAKKTKQEILQNYAIK